MSDDDKRNLLLVEIHERLARVEERLKDLPEIKQQLTAFEQQFTSMRIRVAGTSASIAVIIALVVSFISRSVR